MAKKRKLSDLTTQESDIFLQMIENFKQAFSEEDEDEKSVIASLDHVAAKLAEVQVSASLGLGNVSVMKHVPFSSATSLSFARAKIKAEPLTVISNKIPELKSLGLKEGVGSNQLTVNQTRDLISLIRAHVSFSTEAGRRILVNVILLHVVSNISGAEVDVSIVPEFRMDSTSFGYAATSYGGVVDFLIVKEPPAYIKFLLDGPRYGQTLLVKHLPSQERWV